MIPEVRAMPEFSIVSPVYREGGFLRVFLGTLEETMQSLDTTYEIILVDDGSPDNTWAVLSEEAFRHPALRCLRLSRNFGKEAAMAAGLYAAKGRAVITLDSDLQHPPALISQMASIWREGLADVVEAQKTERQAESCFNRAMALLFYRIFRWTSSIDINGASDFKLLDRRVVEAWKQLPENRVFYRGMTSWLGFRHMYIPFTPPQRGEGRSRWSLAQKCRLAADSLSAYTARLLVLVWFLSMVFFIFAVLVGVEAVWMKISDVADDGFTTVVLLILIMGTAVLFSISLLCVYIRQIFYEIKRRPRYIISEDVSGNKYQTQPGNSCPSSYENDSSEKQGHADDPLFFSSR